jgi:hypothetical protein
MQLVQDGGALDKGICYTQVFRQDESHDRIPVIICMN